MTWNTRARTRTLAPVLLTAVTACAVAAVPMQVASASDSSPATSTVTGARTGAQPALTAENQAVVDAFEERLRAATDETAAAAQVGWETTRTDDFSGEVLTYTTALDPVAKVAREQAPAELGSGVTLFDLRRFRAFEDLPALTDKVDIRRVRSVLPDQRVWVRDEFEPDRYSIEHPSRFLLLLAGDLGASGVAAMARTAEAEGLPLTSTSASTETGGEQLRLEAGESGEAGLLVFTFDDDGALVSYEEEFTSPAVDGGRVTTTLTHTWEYGDQQLALPEKGTSVSQERVVDLLRAQSRADVADEVSLLALGTSSTPRQLVRRARGGDVPTYTRLTARVLPGRLVSLRYRDAEAGLTHTTLFRVERGEVSIVDRTTEAFQPLWVG